MSFLPRLAALRRPPVFYGWWIAGVGLTLQVVQTGFLMQAFGAYFVPIQEEFGWSKTVLSGTYSLLWVASGVLGPLQGRLIDRLGPRTVARFGFICYSLGFLALSRVESIGLYYGAFVILALGYTFGGWITLTVAAANWFRRRRGRALAMVTAGGPLGGFIVPLAAVILAASGWRTTMVIMAILFLVVGLPLIQLLRRRPEDYGLQPDGGAPGPTPSGAPEDTTPETAADAGEFTISEAIRTRAFWLIALGHGSALLIVASLGVHFIPHVVDRLGLSVARASSLLVVMTAFTLVGQVMGGYVADRVDNRLVAAAAMFGHLGGMLALAFGTNIWWVLVFAMLHGSAWGIRGPLMSAIRADYFGRKALGSVLGYSMPITMIGTVGGPLLAGFIADTWGTYQPAFIILGVLASLGSVFFLAARRPSLPHRAATEAAA